MKALIDHIGFADLLELELTESILFDKSRKRHHNPDLKNLGFPYHR